MKPFTKNETLGVLVIFAFLIVISVPNFILSLRRARDQVRRDDMGALVHAFDEYSADFRIYPPASVDGRIMDCKKPGDSVSIDKKGLLVLDLIPCDWGKDAFLDLTPGSKKVYMQILSQDPYYNKGITYKYFSDGSRYQILGYMEGEKDEAEYDPAIVARNVMCGVKVCNVGRSYGVPTNISIEEYDKQLFNEKKQK